MPGRSVFHGLPMRGGEKFRVGQTGDAGLFVGGVESFEVFDSEFLDSGLDYLDDFFFCREVWSVLW